MGLSSLNLHSQSRTQCGSEKSSLQMVLFQNYRLGPRWLGPYHIVPKLRVDFMKAYVRYSKGVHTMAAGRERRKGRSPIPFPDVLP